MLYNILTEICHLQYIVLNVCSSYIFISLYCLHLQSQKILKYTHINNTFYKTTIQTVLYLLSICWFPLWIHVTNGIVKIFRFGIHYLLIFRRIKKIQIFFDQKKCSFVIGIIYPTSSNTYRMIDITSSVKNLN